MVKYITMLNRASRLYAGRTDVNYRDLTFDEKAYVRNMVDSHMAGDESRGGLGKAQIRYIYKGGQLPRANRRKRL